MVNFQGVFSFLNDEKEKNQSNIIFDISIKISGNFLSYNHVVSNIQSIGICSIFPESKRLLRDDKG